MSSEDIINVEAGIYSITVTDIHGCSGTTTSEVEAAPAITLNLNANNAMCNGAANGSINLTVSQGMPPFSYQWSNGETTENVDNLTAGTYSVTVSDANGCQGFASATITQPSALLTVISSTTLDCAGDTDGTAYITAIGGSAPYQYAWSTGAASPFINALSSGTYTVTLTDTYGCSVVDSIEIMEPAPIEITMTASSLDCQSDNTGSIETSISGGEAPYTYLWANGETTENLSNLEAGVYSLIVTDNKGCTGT